MSQNVEPVIRLMTHRTSLFQRQEQPEEACRTGAYKRVLDPLITQKENQHLPGRNGVRGPVFAPCWRPVAVDVPRAVGIGVVAFLATLVINVVAGRIIGVDLAKAHPAVIIGGQRDELQPP